MGASTGTTGGTSPAATSSTIATAASDASEDSSTAAPDPTSTAAVPGTDTGEPDCSGQETIVAAFAQEDLDPPMALSFAPAPIGNYAFSEEENAGAVTVQFEIDCGDDYVLWALVHDEDSDPFDDGGNADSYAVRVDAGVEREWSYGCSTFFQVDPWSYERVGTASLLNCAIEEEVTYALTAGFHTATFRNLEAGTHGGDNPGSAAAIARIVLTTEPDYIPDPDLD
jgi:hypothetical protein